MLPLLAYTTPSQTLYTAGANIYSSNIKLHTFMPVIERDFMNQAITRSLALVQFYFICIVLYALQMLKQLFWNLHLQVGHNFTLMQSTNKQTVLWMLCRALAWFSAANRLCVNMHEISPIRPSCPLIFNFFFHRSDYRWSVLSIAHHHFH